MNQIRARFFGDKTSGLKVALSARWRRVEFRVRRGEKRVGYCVEEDTFSSSRRSRELDHKC